MLDLLVDKHIKFILSFNERKLIEYWETESRKLQSINWVVNTLFVLGRKDLIPRDDILDFVMSCKYEDDSIEAFGESSCTDPHLLNTFYAVQVLAVCDALDGINFDKIAKYISSLQDLETGAFKGYFWDEIDTRFSYSAVCCLGIIDRLDAIDIEKVVKWILKCQNLDGGFGQVPGAESHAGHVLSCIGTLSVLKRLDVIDIDLIGLWLSERQVLSGGLNGRPEKLEDVCYSWWVFSSLVMINRSHWINNEYLINFILSCQDFKNGGISERPEMQPDIFHTCFAILSLSILKYPGLLEINPVYFLPVEVVQKLKMNKI
ncbi:hypothetical protein MERGE_000235 [Pneumocystis wakefieldiae]|uniref:Geranylgeranyl transferase type-2 subunit beta n=1 Tax=Pneumocystis wakefieldiae TaxID=38082 RepID=A0A899FJ48_9ASCO|nr:hypothetical protein MERGE_000235 [Pneumocystis wakefieldiae]